jgi:hypothetical protein
MSHLPTLPRLLGLHPLTNKKDSTIMRFPIPSPGINACALTWSPPLELSARTWNFTTKGDITEIEVWQLIAPSATSAITPSGMDELDYDTLSYSTLPVRGELLGGTRSHGQAEQHNIGVRLSQRCTEFDRGDEVSARSVSFKL